MAWQAFVGKMLGGGIGAAADGIAGAIDRFVETDEEKKAAEMLKMRIMQEPDRWQAEINKIGAGHRSMFVAGWRPALGWICAFGIGWAFVISPFAEVMLNILIAKKVVAEGLIVLPKLSTGQLLDIILGMLGLGALRSYEKTKGLTR